MKKLMTALLLVSGPTAAFADCGEVTITEMGWASSAIVTQVSKFIMENGYGCEVTVVPSDTVPSLTSVAENGTPDIVTELWPTAAGPVFEKLRDAGKITVAGNVLKPGGVEGWWIPTYLVKEHPELATIEGIMANPELVGGRFNNCPEGWGCRVTSDNLIKAFKLEDAGISIFNHGSGETLASSVAAAYADHEPWFGFYWGPTEILGKYDMTSVDLGAYDAEAFQVLRDPNAVDPKPSSYQNAPVYTVVTDSLQSREPAVAELMGKVSFETDTMNALLAWKADNGASNEETAVYFIQNNKDAWGSWLNDDARARLAALLK